uniref:LamG-like jellyroll fold domain-containing protein n=1 Tax=uncultured Winogradskyella sp. TaxID=395353 RepID=UPI003513D85E
TAPTATDNCEGTITGTTTDPTSYTEQGTYTVTWTYDDGNGNTSTQTQNVVIDDVIPPTVSCQDITVSLINGSVNISPLQIDNGSFDNCSDVTMTVSPNSFDCSNLGSNVVTLTVTDVVGNTSSCTATVTVQDNQAPDVVCISPSSLILDLDPVTGQAIINVDQIDNGSTDFCGIATRSLSKTTFTCTDAGENTVTLTVVDVNGNSSTCSTVVVVNPPTITTGSITGIVVNPLPDNPEPPSDLIEVTSCPGGVAVPKDVQLNFDLTGSNIIPSNISSWQISNDEGATWNDVAGTAGQTTITLVGLTSTTLVRATILSGNCTSISPYALIRFLPADDPPIIESVSNTEICLGESVDIVATSFFEYGGQFGGGGYFNEANPEGWLVDGVEFLPAAANNTNLPNWFETNGPRIFGGIRYDTNDGSKFAIANGAITTTLETPIFSTIGMSASEAIIEFYQAYYFCDGAFGTIELSLDGGATYDIVLNTDQFDDLSSGNNSGFSVLSNSGSCGGNNNGQQPTTDPLQFASIDLSAYLNQPSLRIRFTYNGENSYTCEEASFPPGEGNTCNSIPSNFDVHSAWVIDDVGFPFAPIDEVLEWTDENGGVIAIGNDVSVTPITPGVREFGVTALVNGCRADTDDGTEFITINTSLAYAGKDFTPISGECGQSSIQLMAYDNTISALDNYNNNVWEPGLYIYPGQSYDHDNDPNTPDLVAGNYDGTGVAGTWSIQSANTLSCGNSAVFSSNTDPRAVFTADEGTYVLRWTLENGCFDEISVTINSCDQINFDGDDDYITFRNNYSLNNNFTVETWIKPNSINGYSTVFSKKLASVNNSGYDLSINNGQVLFNWYSNSGNGTIASNANINTDRWYHLALSYDGATYRLFIDGIDIGTQSGVPTSPNVVSANVECILGAMDNAAGPSNNTINNFHGWIDEVRIWNTALQVTQIREMMNQRIQENGGAVQGLALSLNVPGLNWADLEGYYRMDRGCGNLIPVKGVAGRLTNITTNQELTAPLPYTSRIDGQDWATDNTWTHFNVWDAPNSIGIDGTTPIDWNIVQTSHDILSGDKNITVLGLISDNVNKELTIRDPFTPNDETNAGQFLRITRYLRLDGIIDLVGESQLVQDENSILDNASLGKLERDQQGTTNLYNYNYWSSPVTSQGANNNSPYSVNSVLRDGTNTNAANLQSINWIGGYDAVPTSPISLPSYWIWSYENYLEDTYSAWNPIGPNGSLSPGLAFTMKGSGASSTYQNYVFTGKPNNGTITNIISSGNQVLAGNPYPSAIDANEFIKDNLPAYASDANPGTSGSIDGSLYFWEHYVSNVTHILEEYEGGYAVYTLAGGVQAVSPPLVSGEGTPTLTPNRYIPVAQGFFVTSSPEGGNVTFNNDQRIFVTEGSGNSQFFRNQQSSSNNAMQDIETIKRLRFDYQAADGFVRHLLLAFTENDVATDGFDYGYDAEMTDILPNDIGFGIEDKTYVIQGVGMFNNSLIYPLNLFANMTGTVSLSLTEIENFENTPNVYVFDSLLDSYTLMNESSFELTLNEGSYINRFYIVFEDQNSLGIEDVEKNKLSIRFLSTTRDILITSKLVDAINKVELLSITGQKLYSFSKNEFELNHISQSIRIAAPNISDAVYIVKCYTDTDTYNKKILIKH